MLDSFKARLIPLISALGGVFFAGQAALAQSPCYLNGRMVPCEQLANATKGFLGYGLAMFGIVLVLGLLSTIFWIMMIVHVATKPVENKAMWIILMVLTGVLGSIIYYFAVKRPFDQQALSGPTMGGMKR